MSQDDVNRVDKPESGEPYLPATGVDVRTLDTRSGSTGMSVDVAKVSAFVIVTGTLLTGIAVPTVMFVGIAAIMLGTMLPVLWPENSPEDVWRTTAERLNQIVEKAIREHVIAEAIIRAAMLRDKCKNLKMYLDAWLQSDKLSGREQLVTAYHNLVFSFMPDLLMFTVEPYKSTLLPNYVNAGLNYLAILKAIYPYADELQLNARDLGSGKAMVAAQIRKDTSTLVDQAVRSYRDGLKQILIRSKNNSPEEMWTWAEYNEYRNLNTLAAMDFVAIFPYCDPLTYGQHCYPRCLNRRLLTLVETTAFEEVSHQIERVEELFNKGAPVRALFALTMFSDKLANGVTVFDGLGKIQCTVQSVDGFFILFELPETGPESLSNLNEQVLYDFYSINQVSGDYSITRNSDEHTLRTIVAMDLLLLLKKEGEKTYWKLEFTGSNFIEKKAFKTGFPIDKEMWPSKVFPDAPVYSEKLVEMEVVQSAYSAHLAFLFKWQHFSVTPDLQLLSNHEIGGAVENPIEQFHAIRAATSIQKGGLEIVPGAGFTGGDLVEVGPGKVLEFRMVNDGKKWFAGLYKVRLWFYQSTAQRQVEIFIMPDDESLPSRVSATIAAGTRITNVANPAYEDLSSYTLEDPVLISRSMRFANLIFRNTSSFALIVLDRIELIFAASASDPVSRSSVNTESVSSAAV